MYGIYGLDKVHMEWHVRHLGGNAGKGWESQSSCVSLSTCFLRLVHVVAQGFSGGIPTLCVDLFYFSVASFTSGGHDSS